MFLNSDLNRFQEIISSLDEHPRVRMLGAVVKHAPFWNMFQIGIVCRSEKCGTLKKVSDWHCANCADNNVPLFLTHRIWSSPTFITKKKQLIKCSSLTLPLVSLHFLFFRTLRLRSVFDITKFVGYNANLKHVSEWHILERHVTRLMFLVLCLVLAVNCVTSSYIDKSAPFQNRISVIHNIFVKFLQTIYFHKAESARKIDALVNF